MRILFLVALATALWGQSVPRAACFPVEELSTTDRAKAEALFLKILDSEGLYTVIGGVKPMSSGFVSARGLADAKRFPEAEETQRLLAYFRCGEEIWATMHHFAKTFPKGKDGPLERYFEGAVFHRSAVRRLVAAQDIFFASLGLTVETHPLETLMTIEFAEASSRFRGLGLLYGYPEYAVNFFVQASEEQTRTGQFVVRDFVGSPTFARAERGVVYAVPKGHQESEIDTRLRGRFTKILEEYRSRREKFVGEGKPGVVALLRDWFCQGDRCQAPKAVE